MNGKTINPRSTMTDEELAKEYMEIAGFSFTPEDEPVEEVPLEIVEETPAKAPKFVFSFDMMDENGPSEKFVMNALQEAMADVLRQNSKEMARARFFINGEDENGLPYGNFNGAGARAITMYQPEHPKAGKGRNYGKVFYPWTDERVVSLMNAIFEECGWDPQELLK